MIGDPNDEDEDRTIALLEEQIGALNCQEEEEDDDEDSDSMDDAIDAECCEDETNTDI